MSDKDVLEILGEKVALGKSATVSFNVAKLHTQNTIDVPIIIERSKKPGPTVLITAFLDVFGFPYINQLIISIIILVHSRLLRQGFYL